METTAERMQLRLLIHKAKKYDKIVKWLEDVQNKDEDLIDFIVKELCVKLK